MIKTVTKDQQYALQRVLHMAGHTASTALSRLLDKKVHVTTTELHIDEIQNMPKFVKNPQELMTIVLVEISNDMPGHLMLICDPVGTMELLTILTGKKVEHIKVIDELEKSALGEVGNIFTGSAISALNDLLHFNIDQSVPDVAIDMVGALFNNLMGEIEMMSDTALEFSMEFKVDKTNIKGSFLALLSPESTKKNLEAINNKNKKE